MLGFFSPAVEFFQENFCPVQSHTIRVLRFRHVLLGHTEKRDKCGQKTRGQKVRSPSSADGLIWECLFKRFCCTGKYHEFVELRGLEHFVAGLADAAPPVGFSTKVSSVWRRADVVPFFSMKSVFDENSPSRWWQLKYCLFSPLPREDSQFD